MNKIVEVLGIPPRALLDKAQKLRKYFEKTADGSYQLRKYKDSRRVRQLYNLVLFLLSQGAGIYFRSSNLHLSI